MDLAYDGGGRLGGLGGSVERSWWGVPPTWDELLALEPRLASEADSAELSGEMGDANDNGIRRSMERLVGWDSENARHPVLGDASAWNVAFGHLLDLQERGWRSRRRRRRGRSR